MREEDTVCVGSDGLRYCKVCGEAKEAFFPEGGFMGMKKHSRQCACDRKAYEEEQKYFKDKEHQELVSRNTSICFDESRMEEWTFENADMSDAVMHREKKYVENWEEMKRNHVLIKQARGLWLFQRLPMMEIQSPCVRSLYLNIPNSYLQWGKGAAEFLVGYEKW